jgi:hypothetical protein
VLAAGEDIDLGGHDHIGKADEFEQLAPLCFQQSTGDSPTPEFDVVFCLLGDWFVHKDVADLHAATRPKDAVDLAEHGSFVGAKVDDAVADHDIGLAIVDGQGLSETFAHVNIFEAERAGTGLSAFAHLRSHVDGQDLAGCADLLRGDEGIEPGAAANIDNNLAGIQFPEEEWVACPCEGIDGFWWQRVDDLLRVTEHLGEGLTRMEVEAHFGVGSHIAVLLCDEASEVFPVDGGDTNWGLSQSSAPFRMAEPSR